MTRGDPMSPLRWTCKSAAKLATELQARGHAVSERSVNRLLHDLDYSLQSNRKTIEGKGHPDRDAQFQYINRRVQAFQRQGQPVLSVDAKKKELVGQFRNGGREWQPQGQPEEVEVYDFAKRDLGKAIPYGIYGVTPRNGKNCTLRNRRRLLIEESSDGSSADAERLGNLPLADPLLEESFDLGGVSGDRRRPTVRAALLAGLSDPGLHAIAEDVPLELGEDRKHAGQGPAARRGQVERLAERDEADLECGQLLERRDQIDQGTPPAIQPPDQDQVQFAPLRRPEQALPLGALANA